jgi:glycosyltransferase involved in cell wall biosynthesis
LKFVYVTREIPEPNVAGHLSYIYAIIDHLQRRGHEITIVVISGCLDFQRKDYSPHYRRTSIRMVGRDIIWLGGAVWVRSNIKERLRRWRDRAAGFFRQSTLEIPDREQKTRGDGIDEVIGEFVDDVEARHAARFVDASKPDAIFVDTIFLTNVLEHVTSSAQRLVITHDIFHRRWQSLVSRGYCVSPTSLSADDEAALLGRFDTIVAIQPEEAQLLRELVPSRKVITASMPATFTSLPPEARVPGRFIFVGSAGLTNADGVRWFIDRVWPAIREAVPHAELHVYGGVCSLLSDAERPGILLRGHTSDLTPAYREATIAVAPLKAGSGLKIKVLEYLCHGLPCIATRVGIAGLQAAVEPPFLIADDAETFASHSIKLCSDNEMFGKLQRRTKSYVELYARHRVFRELDRCIEGEHLPVPTPRQRRR